MARGKRVEIVKVTVTGPDGTAIEADGKECTRCGEVKALADYGADKRKSDGRRPHCKECEHQYKVRNRERSREYRRLYYLENAQSAKEYSRIWARDNPEKQKAKNSKWASENKPKIKARDVRRRTIKAHLLDGGVSLLKRSRCELTSTKTDIHIEHWIPINSGHCGTYEGNIYGLVGHLNLSKSDSNPFEWFEANGQRFELSQTAFDTLVAKLAQRNGLTPEEFRDFTYWCFANRRTVTQVRADNLRYGYKRPSLEIWRESVGLPFPIRVDFGDLTLGRVGVAGSHPTEDIASITKEVA